MGSIGIKKFVAGALSSFAALACIATSAPAGVIVGGSSLIGSLDYSDTFTLTANGGAAGRPDNVMPVGSPGINVENNYGNAAQAWSDNRWSLNTDTSVSSAGKYPAGTSGSGSDTGITQTSSNLDFGIDYNSLREEYVVQVDAVQVSDRIDITTNITRNSIATAGQGLSIFFRADGAGTEIGLFNGSAEANTGFESPITGSGIWYNYAVRFDIPDNELEIYVDEVSLGVIDLSTFAGGAFSFVGMTDPNKAVSVGGADANPNRRLWTDNFQVGSVAVIPEPSSLLLVSLGWVGLLGYGRRQR